MANNTAIRRLDLGYFVRPASETGGPQPRVEPVLAYLVRHHEGLIPFDTASVPQIPEPKLTTAPGAEGWRAPSQTPEFPSRMSPWW